MARVPWQGAAETVATHAGNPSPLHSWGTWDCEPGIVTAPAFQIEDRSLGFWVKF